MKHKKEETHPKKKDKKSVHHSSGVSLARRIVDDRDMHTERIHMIFMR